MLNGRGMPITLPETKKLTSKSKRVPITANWCQIFKRENAYLTCVRCFSRAFVRREAGHPTLELLKPKNHQRKYCTAEKCLTIGCYFGSKNSQVAYYFHVNGSIGIVQKIDFEIRPDLGCTTLKTSRKVDLDNPSVSVCLSVCPSVRLSVCLTVCLAVAFPASSHGRMGKPIELKL